MLNDPGILAVRSSAEVPAREAARIAAEVLRPRADRCWVQPARVPAAPDGPARFVETGIRLAHGSGEAGVPSQADVLWVLCQLARFARELHVEFEVQLAGLRGRVSTGGLDGGARALLAAAQASPERRLSSRPAGAAARAQTAAALGPAEIGEPAAAGVPAAVGVPAAAGVPATVGVPAGPAEVGEPARRTRREERRRAHKLFAHAG